MELIRWSIGSYKYCNQEDYMFCIPGQPIKKEIGIEMLWLVFICMLHLEKSAGMVNIVVTSVLKFC
jgi:hypothetical protein